MKLKAISIAALVSAIAVAPVYAQGTRPANPWLFGLTGGTVDIDENNFDDAANFGAYANYLLSEDERGAFFVEGVYTRTFNDGDVLTGEWDIETLAAYGGFRTAGPWFLKAKAGYGWRDVNITNIAPGQGIDGSETNLTFGAGGGFRLNNDTGLELEYTYLDSDISMLTLGIFTRF